MTAAPSISIIIPVMNEKLLINDLIAHIRSLDGSEHTQIIIVDGERDKRTVKAVKDPKVTKIVSSRGRARQMNEGARIAAGRTLLFLHADTRLPHNALLCIEEALANGRYTAGAFDLGIQSKKFVFRLIEYSASIRSRITRIPFGDQALFIKKEYFDAIGGFHDIPLMEDVEIMQRIKKRRDEICIVRQRVSTSPRRWIREGILHCTLRNWFLQFLYYSGIPPNRLARFYRHR